MKLNIDSIVTQDMGRDDGSLRPGQVALANDTRFGESYFNQPLTTYSVGWRDPNDIQATLDFLAPPVEVNRWFTYAEWLNAEQFLSDSDDVRSIGSEFKRAEYKSIKTTAKTENKGLTYRADLDELVQKPGWEEAIVSRLMTRLLRNELRRAVALASAAATNTAKTWDTTAGKDPDQDVLTDLIASQNSSGIYPTRVLYGHTAWSKRILSHRSQTLAGGMASAGLSPDQVAGFLGVNHVLVSKERYQSATASKSEIVSNLVLEFIGQDGVSVEDPSSLKRFISPCVDGSRFRVYTQQMSAKLYDITVEHYCLTKVTSTTGLRKLTIS